MNEAFEKYIVDRDISTLTSMVFFKGMSHTAASNLAGHFELNGPVMATSAACASALQAICLGTQMIASGRSRMLLCGGAEELHPTVTASFDILEATSIRFLDAPSRTPRPFDRDRDGLVCGEGAGVLVLEELEHARSRGAPVFAEIEGFALNTSNTQVTQSDPESQAACMRAALENASIRADDIDYLNAHATGTPVGDRAEARAVAEIFDNRVPVSSLKGYLGHMLGACGAVESAACLEMMRNNVVYPGLNLDNIESDCSIINLIREKKDHPVRRVLKNAFAFGGINVSIVYRRPSA
jgi:3-oxoacyl-[acyl-carrier-protein] synthase II